MTAGSVKIEICGELDKSHSVPRWDVSQEEWAEEGAARR